MISDVLRRVNWQFRGSWTLGKRVHDVMRTAVLRHRRDRFIFTFIYSPMLAFRSLSTNFMTLVW